MPPWEADQEDFLVLSGEALLIIEGRERPLRQWDFVHCPPETKHVIIGAGDIPCLVLAVGAREHQGMLGWGGYSVDELALRHGAGVEEETADANRGLCAVPKVRANAVPGWLDRVKPKARCQFLPQGDIPAHSRIAETLGRRRRDHAEIQTRGSAGPRTRTPGFDVRAPSLAARQCPQPLVVDGVHQRVRMTMHQLPVRFGRAPEDPRHAQ